ncbi:MAG TPA: ABC transporter permease [Bacteroidota bacterium]|nr:ABC transporter permease [Bacteroidota bacterium]
MRVEQTIALRYLFSKRSIAFVNVISFISVIGVTIGVAALIVVLSVFNGFGGLVTSLLVSFDPHLRIESVKRANADAYQSLTQYLASQSDVRGYAPFVNGKALVVSRGITRVINVRGIDPDKIAEVSGLAQKIVLGDANLKDENKGGIVLGMALADRLGAIVGDTISVVSPSGVEVALLQMGQPLIRRFRVAGIYETNNKDYDSYYAYVNLEAGQTLFGLKQQIDGIEVRFKDLSYTSHYKSELEQRFGSEFRILTWFDLHKELYTVMQIERWAAYLILCLIIAVASFNLLGSLTMAVIEKRRDIGILKTMGITNVLVSRIFLLQGLAVGIAGALLGTGLGLGLVYLQQRYHLFPLDPTVYIIPAIPVEVRWLDLVVVPVAAVVLCLLAARYPARRAAQLIPVEAIRWE